MNTRIIGDRWAARCHQLRTFLDRNRVPFDFVDVTDLGLTGAIDGLPIVMLPDGTKMQAPTVSELAASLGMVTKPQRGDYDLAIVGAGPGGLAAAVYAASEGLRTIMIEREAPGGQAGTSSRIENYLGFPAGLSGAELTERSVAQAKKFGVEILSPTEARALRIEGDHKVLTLCDGSELRCRTMMLAIGVSWRRLPAEGADRLTGAGVYYGSSPAEAEFTKGRTVYMVGGGNSVGQAAMFFRDHAEKVVLLVRGDSLGAKMSQYLVSRIEEADNIEVRLRTEIVRCNGEDRLESLDLRSREDGKVETVPAEYLFAFLGAVPRIEWLDGQVECDGDGFVLTGADAAHAWPLDRAPYPLETSVPGVFACGDARHNSVKRVASAAGEGAVSVSFVHQVLAEQAGPDREG